MRRRERPRIDTHPTPALEFCKLDHPMRQGIHKGDLNEKFGFGCSGGRSYVWVFGR